MASSTFLKRKDKKPDAGASGAFPGEEPGPVQEARVRARRRLIGAVVLLAIGVIVFPLLFETQPRSLPGEVVIEMPRQGEPATQTTVRPANSGVVTALPPAAESTAPPAKADEVKPAARELATAPAPAPVSSAEPAAAPAPAAPTAAAAGPATPAPAPSAQPGGEKSAQAAKAEAERVRALLEDRATAAAPVAAGAPSALPEQGRFVVQIGAYSDATTMREVRSRVERLGLKTYIQVVETPEGPRTRVRVGPFGSRGEADAASGKLQAAGLPGRILTL